MKTLYHYSYSFADAITPEIVNRVSGIKVPSENAFKEPGASSNGILSRAARKFCRVLNRHSGARGPRLISLGSVFQLARNGDIVWGTGINPHFQRKLPAGTKIDIRSVRGPLSRQYIIDELGLECPESYGDPGILIPSLFPEFNRPIEPRHEYLVICQHVDELFVQKYPSRFKAHNIYICQRPHRVDWREVVKEILNSRFIIASSLHAIIIAEAFGIPARWWYNDLLPSYYTAGTFKYNDYYLSTGRQPNPFACSIDEALEMGGNSPIRVNLASSIEATFPADRLVDRISKPVT